MAYLDKRADPTLARKALYTCKMIVVNANTLKMRKD